MGIFKSWALKYFERGIPVIPLSGKIPLVTNWSTWSTRQQTLEEVEWLIEKYPTANIGAVAGFSFTAIDIDTDDPRILQAVPYTPIRRRGKKGLIYFYRTNNIENIGSGKYPVEFLNVGRQAVLPPSIHPETGKAYEWVGEEDVLTFTDLPDVTSAQLTQLLQLCERYGIHSPRKVIANSPENHAALTDPGRNNKLARIAYAMACDSVPKDDAVKRLLEFDKKEHETPWFSDPTEPHKGRNAKKAALTMYERAIKAAESKGDVRPAVSAELYLPFMNRASPPPYPRPRGMMRMFQDYCQSVSNGAQDALGLGGAVTLMAGIASNRFRTKVGHFDVWPNVFVLNLAYSGFGKETPQKAIEELLIESTLIGSASYKSGSSIVMGLPEQQERVDLIDECSSLIKTMGSREDYKSEIVELLSSLYSKSSGRFLGVSTRADGARFGACWNPCINILGSTTPAGFKQSVTRDMAAKGLIPRFLVFYQRDVGEFKRVNGEAKLIFSELRRLVRALLSHPKHKHDEHPQDLLADTDKSVRYMPDLIPCSGAAERLWFDITEQYFNEGKKDPEGFQSAFKNRFAQHVIKLALLDAVSLGMAEITVDNIEWAHEVVKIQWANAQDLYELASAENEHEKNVLKIMQHIRTKGVVSRTELWRLFTHIKRHDLDGMLSQLLAGEQIEKVALPSDKPGPKPIGYRSHIN